MSNGRWAQLMDSLYEEEGEADVDPVHNGINPEHFDAKVSVNANVAGNASSVKATLTRTLSQKFASPNKAVVKHSGNEVPSKRTSLTRTLSQKFAKAPEQSSVVKSSTEVKRASLTRTLSQKFAPNQAIVSATGRKRMTRALLASEDVRTLARDYVFDAAVWKDAFRGASTREMRSRLRLLVLEGTRAAAVEEHYWALLKKEPKKIPLVTHAHTMENVAMFDFGTDAQPGLALREARYSGTAHFIYADVVDVGVFMKQEQRCDPLILVFANASKLGGVLDGGISQEEYVLRRTNLMNVVNNEVGKPVRRKWTYSLPAHGGLYVPSAHVVRSNESTGYKFLQKPIRLSFVLAAAPLNTSCDQFNNDPAFVADWKRRIDSVFAIGVQKGHDSLVLGAWGCGELGNNCKQVAALMYEALTTRFRGCFKHVVFTFLHDPVAFAVFCEEFGSPRMPVPAEVEVRHRKQLPAAVDGKSAKSAAVGEDEVRSALEKVSISGLAGNSSTSHPDGAADSESEEVLNWGAVN